MCYFPLRLSVLFHIYVFDVPCICQRTADFTWHSTPYFVHTVKTPDPTPERGRSRDSENSADQLHVPPAN